MQCWLSRGGLDLIFFRILGTAFNGDIQEIHLWVPERIQETVLVRPSTTDTLSCVGFTSMHQYVGIGRDITV